MQYARDGAMVHNPVGVVVVPVCGRLGGNSLYQCARFPNAAPRTSVQGMDQHGNSTTVHEVVDKQVSARTYKPQYTIA